MKQYTQTFSFFEPVTGITYILLEGENAQKVEEGDVLTIKSDATGAIDRCIKSTVLKKEAKERDFIGLLNPSGQQILVPSGVYAEIKTNGIILGSLEKTTFVTTQDTDSTITGELFPIAKLPINFNGPAFSPVFIDEKLLSGDQIYLELRFSRPQRLVGCPRRIYSLSQNIK